MEVLLMEVAAVDMEALPMEVAVGVDHLMEVPAAAIIKIKV